MASTTVSESPHARISRSRQVLYDPERTSHQYVATYQNFWAEHYDNDGHQLGFMAWQHAADTIERFVPDRNALVLDYCGGTGQVGKMLHARGYTRLHVSDGSANMLKQAVATGAYEQAFLATVPRDSIASFLENSGCTYDCVLSSMSLSEFRPLVQQIVTRVLKPGGVFISLEALPHIEKAQLSGIKWVLDCWNDPQMRDDLPFRVLLNDDNASHDRFTDDKMKLLVVQRK